MALREVKTVSKPHILVVDDEEDILELARYNLANEGYQVSCVDTGEKAVEMARRNKPDLVVLDLMLPGMDGFEVCKILKNNAQTSAIPIVMLTAKGEESDIVTGLELGAEDYITKPFSPKVLIARIRTVLRRKRGQDQQENHKLVVNNIELDPVRFEVKVDGNLVDLTATEYHILHYLLQHPGWVFTRAQIIDAVKGTDYPVTDRSVDVQIVGLRKKLGKSGEYIQTVRGVGYRFLE
jgi:two-component system alkaline phosphatase synthesis response regulator PhoP